MGTLSQTQNLQSTQQPPRPNQLTTRQQLAPDGSKYLKIGDINTMQKQIDNTLNQTYNPASASLLDGKKLNQLFEFSGQKKNRQDGSALAQTGSNDYALNNYNGDYIPH